MWGFILVIIKNKKIAITGPLGHIGSKFIHSLKKGEFDRVILLDNLSTQRYGSLFNLPEDVPFSFIEGDIRDYALEKLFEGIDVVLHLAAVTDATSSFENAELVNQVNFEGTKRVAEACAKCGCKMVFISTTSVYGAQQAVIDENCSSQDLKPQSPYAESKLRAENLLDQMEKEKGLKYVICRFGTIFGTSPGMRFHTAINKFIWQACLGIPVTVWKLALKQKRPYLDLNDAVSALRFIIDKEIFTNNIYNVVTLNTTVADIIDKIKLYVRDLKIELVDSKIMNQLSYEVSCDKFKKLGFNFTGDLEKGIRETVALLKDRKK